MMRWTVENHANGVNNPNNVFHEKLLIEIAYKKYLKNNL